MNKYLFFLATFLIITNYTIAQDISPEASTTTPYNTVFTHLYYLQKDSYAPEKAATTIYAPSSNEKIKIEAAINLKKILDGKGLYIDMSYVPVDKDYIDTALNKEVYILSAKEERIYLEKINGRWLYSATTIDQIDEMYAEVFPWGIDFFDQILPRKIGDSSFLGLKTWQWLGVLLLILVVLVFYWVLKAFTSLIIKQITKTNISLQNTAKAIIEEIAVAFSLLMSAVLLDALLPSLLLPIELSHILITGIRLITIIFTALLTYRVFKLAMHYFEKIVRKSRSKMDDQLLIIIYTIVKGIITIITITYCLSELNIDVKAIFAGLSIGALALALAAQDTVKNLIGSITIFIDHPFEIGDYITVGDIDGDVEEVGMRSTRIRTPQQSLAYIPNGQLANMSIDNFGLRIYRRWRMELEIEYGTTPAEIEGFMSEVKKLINEHKHTLNEKTEVRLNSISASSLKIFINIFFDVRTWSDDLRCKEEILLNILKKADELKIKFAYPSQRLHIKKEL